MVPLVRDLGTTDYETVWRQMREFTDARVAETPDEIWFTEHRPVYTLGQSGKVEHFLVEPQIPVVHSDRGGQVTYHGPGQIVGYFLVDLKRAGLSVHSFVCTLEQTMIDALACYGMSASRLPKNPGVYVNGRKVGSLGIRVRRGCTYHGISLNVDLDLTPFEDIYPCGIVGMQATDIRRESGPVSIGQVQETLIEKYRSQGVETQLS